MSLLLPYLTCCDLLLLLRLQRCLRVGMLQNSVCEHVLRLISRGGFRQEKQAASVLQHLLPQLANVERVLLQGHPIPAPHCSLLLLPLLLADRWQSSAWDRLLHHLLPCRLWPSPSYYTGLRLHVSCFSSVCLLLTRWSYAHFVVWWRAADFSFTMYLQGRRGTYWLSTQLRHQRVERCKAQVEVEMRTILMELDGRTSWIGTNSEQQQRQRVSELL